MDTVIRSLVAQNAIIAARLATLEAVLVKLPIDGITDPPPDGGGWGAGLGLRWGDLPGWGGGIGLVADPAPPELARLSTLQLESRIADIAFTRKKLDSLEVMLKEALEKVGR